MDFKASQHNQDDVHCHYCVVHVARVKDYLDVRQCRGSLTHLYKKQRFDVDLGSAPPDPCNSISKFTAPTYKTYKMGLKIEVFKNWIRVRTSYRTWARASGRIRVRASDLIRVRASDRIRVRASDRIRMRNIGVMGASARLWRA
jgi:hypothetical protein